ncbi:hypothetical protein GGI07_004682 [Coemansia sp. Benny D115]|nr:hypothetical protein GGI07_004682 [Coemansia sp. Benny D115]
MSFVHEVESEQTAAERRGLRHSYRELLSDAAARQKEYLADTGAQLLLDDLARANELYGSVASTTEGILDARFLVLSAAVSAQRAHQLRIDPSAFDALAFVDHVSRRVQEGGSQGWMGVGRVAGSLSRCAPRFSCLYGPLMADGKAPRAQRRVNPRVRDAATTAAEARIATVDAADVRKQENPTTKLVQKVHKILRKRGPVNLFRLVINPESFAQSVENIFYVSFLVRDGKAFIDDSSGQPMIEACEPPQQEDYQMGLARKQLIFSLDEPTWREIIDAYDIHQCAIPTRTTASQ